MRRKTSRQFSEQSCLQAQLEVLQWLEDEIGASSAAFDGLKGNHAALHAMRKQPELAAAKVNVAALQELLYMSDAQVRSEHTCARFFEIDAAPPIPVRSLESSHAFCSASVRT